MSTTYNVNYEDERFKEVETERDSQLTEVEQTYNGMIDSSNQFYQDQIQASKDWADKQSQLQQENTDFAIDKIEQERQQAQKDYQKEQSGAYVDWQKQSNQYGANAEQMAMSGMSNTGFSESSQVSMYNTYQNRVAIARDTMAKANQNFDNNIQQAILQNNSALAEIQYNALQQQLTLALEGFQYKNSLILELTDKKQQINDNYYARYQDVLDQINYENAQAEAQRQWEEEQRVKQEQWEAEMQYAKDRDKVADEQWQKEYELAQAEAGVGSGVVYVKENSSPKIETPNGTYSGNGGQGSSGANWSQTKKDTTKSYTPLYTISASMGNDASFIEKHEKKGDYYFSNGYQPRYVNNSKLTSINFTVGDIFGKGLGVKESQNVWMTGDGKYWVWDGKSKGYMNVTNLVNEWISLQK